jgi:HPt (histidine-containing phosphotransfer) domain-containing protein
MRRESLMQAGVDYDEGVERFGGNPQIYEKYLAKFFQGHLMEDFVRQIGALDYAAAFRTVHDLKGAAGNFGIREYYAEICTLTELLRGGSPETDCTPLVRHAEALYDAAKKAALEEEK